MEQALGDERGCFIEGCQRDWDRLPFPDGPLTVGIDGAFLRAQRKQGHFEVIAGKSVLAHVRFRGSCALQAHEIQQSEMTALVKPSQRPGTESCVVSGDGHCEA